MAGKLRITESEDQIRVQAPASQRVSRIVIYAVLTVLGGRLGWAPVWRVLNDTGGLGNAAAVYPLLAVPAFLLAAVGIFGLYAELATGTITFERNTIGVERRLAGVRIQRRWIALSEMQKLTKAWSAHGAPPGYLFLKLLRSRPLILLRHIEPVDVDRLCGLLAGRGWRYGDEADGEQTSA